MVPFWPARLTQSLCGVYVIQSDAIPKTQALLKNGTNDSPWGALSSQLLWTNKVGSWGQCVSGCHFLKRRYKKAPWQVVIKDFMAISVSAGMCTPLPWQNSHSDDYILPTYTQPAFSTPYVILPIFFS